MAVLSDADELLRLNNMFVWISESLVENLSLLQIKTALVYPLCFFRCVCGYGCVFVCVCVCVVCVCAHRQMHAGVCVSVYPHVPCDWSSMGQCV